jgi:hypothetical protein
MYMKKISQENRNYLKIESHKRNKKQQDFLFCLKNCFVLVAGEGYCGLRRGSEVKL